jgi:hypothetical protein
LGQQLFGFFGKQRPVGGRVNDDGLEFFAQHATLGIDFIDGHQHGVFQHRLGNGHGARQAVQHTYFDGLLGEHRLHSDQAATDHSGGKCQRLQMTTTIEHEQTPGERKVEDDGR